MISMKVLLDIVCTEAIEGTLGEGDITPGPIYEMLGKPKSNLPPIKYSLKLMQSPDGKLDWVE